jgi:LuxR family transcriptional regulator, maltose regulon positive regulatory protein
MNMAEQQLFTNHREASFLAKAEDYVRVRFASQLVVEKLSPREETVLRMLEKGLVAEEICTVLGSKLNTVRSHIRKIYCKLGVRSSIQAISVARRFGLL